MSRIHEALKKAEQEKAAQMRAGASATVPGDAKQADMSIFAAQPISEETSHLAEHARSAQSTNSAILQFEDLVRSCAHPEWNSDSALRVSLAGDSGKVVGERFRTLRSRLYQIAATRTLRRLLITSSLPAEGKTFVATNLVRSIIRQADRRVLLIDADLRAPHLHVALGAPSSPGLSDYLLGKVDEYAVVQNSVANNLCFIPGGSKVQNPSELLLSDRMKMLLERVTPAFDWVILDSPPALPVHDASSLADLCDGVLFVVRAGETNHEVAKKGSLEFREKNLLGVVLNQVEKSETQGSYYYGHSDKQ
jgi:capsular exopolysaccharide synthesis family protein